MAAASSSSQACPPHSLHTVPLNVVPAISAPSSRIGVLTRPSASSRSPELEVEGADQRQPRAQVAGTGAAEPHHHVHVVRNADTRRDRREHRGVRRRIHPFVAHPGEQLGGQARRLQPLEVADRQRGHQHADVDEQPDPGVAEVGDHLGLAGGRHGRLGSLRLLEPGDVELVQHGLQPPEQVGSGLPDREPHPLRAEPGCGLQLRHQERQALVVVAPAAVRRPLVDARPDDRDRAARGGQGLAQGVDLGIQRRGVGPPDLAGLDLDRVGDPAGHDADGDRGRRPVGADHLGSPVEGRGAEGPAVGDAVHATSRLAARCTTGPSDRSRASRSGSRSGPSEPAERYGTSSRKATST